MTATTRAMPKSESFLRHTAVYGIGAILLQAVGLVLLPIHTRYLPPSDYGLLQLLFRIGEVLNILLLFQGIGLATLNSFKLPGDDAGEKHIAASATLFLAAVTAVGVGVAVLFARPLAQYLDLEGRESLLVVGMLCVLAEGSIMMPLTLMQARLESTWYVATMVGIAILRCLLTFALVVWGGLGLRGVLLSLGLSYAGLGVLLSMREMARTSFLPKFGQVAAIARFAVPFLPTGICFFVIQSGDQFLLTRYAGMEEVGYYGLGNQISRLATMFVIVPVFKVWQTWRYKAYQNERRADLFGEALTRIAFLYAFAAIGLLCFRDTVVLMLGSPEYVDARFVVGPLLLAHFFMGAANFFDAPFHIRSRTDLKPWIAAASTVVILFLYLTWIPTYGNRGAAYATLFGMLFHASCTYFVAQRVMRINLEFARLGWLFAVTIPTGVLMIVLSRLSWLPLRMLLVVAWPIAFWCSGLVSSVEKAQILSWTRQLSDRIAWGKS